MAYAFSMNAPTPGDVAVYAVTAKGLALGRTLARELPATLYAPARLAEGEAVPFASLSELVAETFHQRRAHVFLCACGIAVRAVAPHLRGKAVDPAVVCLALIRHSFRLDLADRDASAAQLRQCGAIASAVPGFGLHYPRDHARSEALLDALFAHLATLPPSPASPMTPATAPAPAIPRP